MPRKYTRLHVPLEIDLDFLSGIREARISDLSMGGCFVECILNVAEGEPIAFDLRISPDESIRIAGEIVYSMANIGFGIRFTDLTDEQKFHLEHLILKHGGTTNISAESRSNE